MFNNNLFNDGYLYFNFTTSHNKEHVPLEEFQMNRQIFGVIGIMHCQQSPDLKESYRNFVKLMTRVCRYSWP